MTDLLLAFPPPVGIFDCRHRPAQHGSDARGWKREGKGRREIVPPCDHTDVDENTHISRRWRIRQKQLTTGGRLSEQHCGVGEWVGHTDRTHRPHQLSISFHVTCGNLPFRHSAIRNSDRTDTRELDDAPGCIYGQRANAHKFLRGLLEASRARIAAASLRDAPYIDVKYRSIASKPAVVTTTIRRRFDAVRLSVDVDNKRQSPQWLVDSLTAHNGAHLRSSALSQQRAYTPA